MIEVTHLSKLYGSYRAVDDLSFRVGEGEVVGFLGPNGAGKSTTLRVLAGFLGASAGRVTVAGHDIADEPNEARQKLGYMPEACPLYPEMRVIEYVRFRAELKGIPRSKRRDAVDKALAAARVDDVASVMIGHLSKGYRQRVGLADALVGSPPLLILDEPTAGLDPNQIREVRALIKKLAADHTVLLSTHILSEVEATCSRAIVIHRGRLVAEGTMDALFRMQRVGLVVRVKATDDADASKAKKLAEETTGVARVTLDETNGKVATLTVGLAEGNDDDDVAEALVRNLVEARVGVLGVGKKAASLESVFGALTEGETAGATR